MKNDISENLGQADPMELGSGQPSPNKIGAVSGLTDYQGRNIDINQEAPEFDENGQIIFKSGLLVEPKQAVTGYKNVSKKKGKGKVTTTSTTSKTTTGVAKFKTAGVKAALGKTIGGLVKGEGTPRKSIKTPTVTKATPGRPSITKSAMNTSKTGGYGASAATTGYGGRKTMPTSKKK